MQRDKLLVKFNWLLVSTISKLLLELQELCDAVLHVFVNREEVTMLAHPRINELMPLPELYKD